MHDRHHIHSSATHLYQNFKNSIGMVSKGHTMGADDDEQD
jgi:hypothetical protein